MKVLALLFLFGVVAARPGHSDEDSHEVGEDDGEWIVDSCLVENWEDDETDEENMKNVGACLQCFKGVGNPMSEDGLPKAKICVEQFLPYQNEACSSDIGEISVDNTDTAQAVLDCFEGFVMGALSERCLNMSSSENAVDILTDGSMCMLETHKNMTEFHKFVKHQGERRVPKKIRDIAQEGRKGMMKNYVMKQLLPIAYCDAANSEDESRVTSCHQCFQAVTNPKQEFAEVIKCSQEYLNPYYQECHDAMISTGQVAGDEGWKNVFKCYIRGLLKFVVTECYTDDVEVTEVDAETLLNTMDCGRHYIINWVTENARPEFSGKIVSFLLEDEEHDHNHAEGDSSEEE